MLWLAVSTGLGVGWFWDLGFRVEGVDLPGNDLGKWRVNYTVFVYGRK